MQKPKKGAHVRYTDKEMFIKSPYDSDYVSAIKEATTSRRWNKDTNEWRVLIAEREIALAVVERFFSITEDNSLSKKADSEPVEPIVPLYVDNTIKYDHGILADAWIDGACEPVNPGGTASYGLVIKQKGEIIFRSAGVVGSGSQMSSNVAEYSGLIALLEWCQKHKISGRIAVHSDSLLLVRQMRRKLIERTLGKPKKKSAKGLYVPFYEKAQLLLSEVGKEHFGFEWIPREENAEADKLTQLAISSYFKESKTPKSGNIKQS